MLPLPTTNIRWCAPSGPWPESLWQLHSEITVSSCLQIITVTASVSGCWYSRRLPARGTPLQCDEGRNMLSKRGRQTCILIRLPGISMLNTMHSACSCVLRCTRNVCRFSSADLARACCGHPWAKKYVTEVHHDNTGTLSDKFFQTGEKKGHPTTIPHEKGLT